MRGVRARLLPLAMVAAGFACSSLPASPPRKLHGDAPSSPEATPAGTATPTATPTAATHPAPGVPSTPIEAPGIERQDWKPLSDALVFHTLGSWPGPVWTLAADGKVFFLAMRGTPAHRQAALLPYPPGGREAAMAGRAVTVAEVWAARPGALARVHVHPVGLQSMVCEEDEDCAFVTLTTKVDAAGGLEVGSGSCPEALARLAAPSRDSTTYDRYDRAVIPAICRATGTFAWNGSAFARRATQAPDPIGARVTTGAPELLEALVGGLFPGAIASSVERNWPTRGGDGRFVLLRATYPAPAHAFFGHARADQPWESGRAIDVAEIWLAIDQSFRRVMQLPAGLRSLAEPARVLSLEIDVKDDVLLVGGDPAICGAEDAARATPADLTPLEASLWRRDRDAARRICAGRGAYRFDGRSFARSGSTGLSSF
jgi:hypothetical protein